jgi:hypothetical protein
MTLPLSSLTLAQRHRTKLAPEKCQPVTSSGAFLKNSQIKSLAESASVIEDVRVRKVRHVCVF